MQYLFFHTLIWNSVDCMERFENGNTVSLLSKKGFTVVKSWKQKVLQYWKCWKAKSQVSQLLFMSLI